MLHSGTIPPEFLLFALSLLGVALFHRWAIYFAVGGLVAVITYKWLFTGFDAGPGWMGLLGHMESEWVTLFNLLGLLVGFALLARHFQASHVPRELTRWLPDDWRGGFLLLIIVFGMSTFLDNIAAALIGGAMAHSVFRGRVRVGYLAAIVAAANAGGAGSVIGDTTTTLMWLHGISPLELVAAFVPSTCALLVFGIPAARAQQRYSPIMKMPPHGEIVDMPRLCIVIGVLAAAMTANIVVNVWGGEYASSFPWLGGTVLVALAASLPIRSPDWRAVPGALGSAAFLISLVTSASMMPVDSLPTPTWLTTLSLGFVSAVFDNIPLTALALEQGGYDWDMLAYAVGFGGSMIWFGSSAGVALSGLYPEARSTVKWLREGWSIAVAYVVGFMVLVYIIGWNPP